MNSNSLIMHCRMGPSRSGEPGIKTFEDRMKEDFVELLNSWSVSKDKIHKIACICFYYGKERYKVPVTHIEITNNMKLAYVNHSQGKREAFNGNFGSQLGKKMGSVQRFYTDLNEKPVN